MLGRTMLGKLPLVSNSLANFSVGEAAFCHVPPEFAQIYRICLSIWMSPSIAAAGNRKDALAPKVRLVNICGGVADVYVERNSSPERSY